jgi:hypothetical protein
MRTPPLLDTGRNRHTCNTRRAVRSGVLCAVRAESIRRENAATLINVLYIYEL